MKALPIDPAVIERAARRVHLECPSLALNREDLAQEGWLALLEAQAAARLPADEPHRSAYAAVRAMGAMRDARTRAEREVPGADGDGTVPELPDDGAPDPVGRVFVRQQLARFRSSRGVTEAMRQVLDGLLAGQTVGQIAAKRGCHPSAVTQIARRVEWSMAMVR